MGTRPGIGFKTNVKDEEFVGEIVEEVVNQVDDVEQKTEGTLVINDDWKLTYAVLDGSNEYFGFSNDGLVFSHRADEYPPWNTFSNRGDVITEIAEVIRDEFEFVDVGDVMPITPFH